jgi:hypothetical protein
VLCVLTLLSACASPPPIDGEAKVDLDASAWARSSEFGGREGRVHWDHMRYGNHKPTRYTATVHQGRPALLAESDAGNSTLRLRLAPAQEVDARWLRFAWQVPTLNARADLRDADVDDAVVRVILTFDGDRDRLSARDHMLSELAHLVTGEPLPYATLMYVWDHRYPVGSVIPNPHTQRIRKLVLESGPQRLNRWVDVERDIEADYRQVFGEAPGRLTAIGVMTDSNNTGESVRAWFGAITLSPPPSTGDRADVANSLDFGPIAQPAALSP